MNAIGDVVFNENVKTTFYYKVESQSDAKIPLPLFKNLRYASVGGFCLWQNTTFATMNPQAFRIYG